MSAELVFAVVGGADLCLKYGNILIQAYQDLKNADEIVLSRVVWLEAFWSRTVSQIEFVKRVAQTMAPEHCRIHIEVFEILRARLTNAKSRLKSLIEPSHQGNPVKKWRVPFLRSSLDDMREQLEMWQRLFDPTWYLILRIENEVIDKEFSRSLSTAANTINTTLVHIISPLFLPGNGLDWTKAETVAYSTTTMVPKIGSSRKYAIDSIDCLSSVELAQLRADTERLAHKLQHVDPDVFGLLKCYGLVKRKSPLTRQISSIDMVFTLPPQSGTPISLRQQLLQPQVFSLTRVLELARQITSAVSFVHTCDFVHKNIRPETILSFAFNGANDANASRVTYLLGFDTFRSVNFHTMRTGDNFWERNLYRHPSRQGLNAHDKYTMQHDVYSIGVCLLEIGLWSSFVDYGDGTETPVGNTTPSKALGLKTEDFEPRAIGWTVSYGHIKDHLVDLARSSLPRRMGDKFTSLVITCLTCLDHDSEDFKDQEEMHDEDGVLLGLKFIEKVVFRISEVSF
ncbi:hypothetical protein BKA67DRAFT_525453 [Truncatella angustata]|uniref:Protein kinase domain-containing protein n=1 Tax=Truncatella angustata TaxID=152316 RepID=A0A9P8RIL9_9PEZI|nr:uncharacterized protein BKA67DRAFT_525453 [Truncatella angustata]KAH6646529.1 hypothetical protein BKA67DRAFT_525453 [Truncatella angustata]